MQDDGSKKDDLRELSAEEKEEQRAMAYTLEAEEATRMVRNRYGGALIATDDPSSPYLVDSFDGVTVVGLSIDPRLCNSIDRQGETQCLTQSTHISSAVSQTQHFIEFPKSQHCFCDLASFRVTIMCSSHVSDHQHAA